MTRHVYELLNQYVRAIEKTNISGWTGPYGFSIPELEKMRSVSCSLVSNSDIFNALKDVFDCAIDLAKNEENGSSTRTLRNKSRALFNKINRCDNVLHCPTGDEDTILDNTYSSYDAFFWKLLWEDALFWNFGDKNILVYPSETSQHAVKLIVCRPQRYDFSTCFFYEEPRFIGLRTENKLGFFDLIEKEIGGNFLENKSKAHTVGQRILENLVKEAEKDRIAEESELGIRMRIYDPY